MKGCIKQTVVISPIDIDGFYKINKDGLCINNSNLLMIRADPDIFKDVKKANTKKIFPNLDK